jgi:hypothetical protein
MLVVLLLRLRGYASPTLRQVLLMIRLLDALLPSKLSEILRFLGCSVMQ